ncbi:hypothetical protein [Aeromicrobium sp. Leaf350]|uniref:hypothetical protein n=1 Tax=Aeromicrobium sp. Leaf350 TaxID=2876565 RepID=UPI001E45EDBF|nr:hypothetical protein [Aeromicrobium sp. Leaf350]
MTYLFPDNTVLCNFAAVERLDVLRQVLDGNGRWCEAVKAEAANSAPFHPQLASIPNEGWLGDAIEVSDAEEIRRIDVIRRQLMGGSARRPTQHLGEAQTCFVIEERSEFSGAVWISDDRDSLEHAKFRRIATRETVDLVRDAVAGSIVTRPVGFALLEQMRSVGRSLRVPRSLNEL